MFKSVLKYNGYPIGEAEKHLAKLQSLAEKEFLNWKQNQLNQIIEHHITSNPIYRAHVGSQGKNWEDIPVLTKNDLQLPLNERLSSGFTKKNIYVNNTSGSSGHPFFFAKDKFCHAMTWAVIFDRFQRHGLTYGESKQARFYGIPLGFPKYHKERLKDFLMSRFRFPVFDLSDEVLEKYVQKFKNNRFEYINGYTSSLVLLAKYCIKENIVLKDWCPSLKVCLVTSEMCTDIDRSILEKGLGVPVVNEYGASELDLIAFEDQDFDWVTTDETLHIEILDENGKQVRPGEVGRVVITSLFNKAMPFIRYDIGDRAALSPQLKGNHHILQELEGRTNDVAILPSGKKVPGLTFYYVSKAMLEAGGFMKEFIIAQTAVDTFRFDYVADRALNEEEISQVCRMMDKYLEPGLKADFNRMDHLERTKAGKLKHFRIEL